MDAKEFLDYISENPPEPVHGGCARIALMPFLRNLQAGGVYHEHRKTAKDFKDLNQSKEVDEVEPISPEASTSASSYIWTCPIPEKVTFVLEPNLKSPRPCLLTYTKDPDTSLGLDNFVLCDSQEGTSVSRRRKVGSSSIGAISRESLCSKCSRSILNESNAFITETAQEIDQSTSPDETSSDFLLRCAVEKQQSAKKIMASLGYMESLSASSSIGGQGKATKEEKQDSKSLAWLKCLCIGRVYAFIVLIITWCYPLRAPMFFMGEHQLNYMTILVPNFWIFAIASLTTPMFVSCVKGDFDLFFQKWRALYQDRTTRSLGIRGVKQTMFVKGAVVFHWINVAISTTTVVFILMMDEQFSAGMNRAFYISGHRSVWDIVLTSVVITLFAFSWLGLMAFFVVLCHLVTSHFREFGQVLRLHIIAASRGFPERLNSLRECHLVLCEAVDVLDRFMSVALCIYIGLSVPQVCVLLYLLINVSMELSVVMINVTWLFWMLVWNVITTYSASNVHVAMHAVANDLYTIHTQNLTVDQLGQLQMFLAKVNGPSLGFTLLGMVVITREFMLTLFGVYITYCVVLIQFK